jgi:hypothetical protein
MLPVDTAFAGPGLRAGKNAIPNPEIVDPLTVVPLPRCAGETKPGHSCLPQSAKPDSARSLAEPRAKSTLALYIHNIYLNRSFLSIVFNPMQVRWMIDPNCLHYPVVRSVWPVRTVPDIGIMRWNTGKVKELPRFSGTRLQILLYNHLQPTVKTIRGKSNT